MIYDEIQCAEGDLAVVRDAIEQSAEALGMTTRRSNSGATLSLDMRQTRPWPVVFVRAQPQRWTWELETIESCVEVRLRSQLRSWYLLTILGLDSAVDGWPVLVHWSA